MKSQDMVEVLSTSDASQIALAKSLLTAEKIEFFARGDIHSAIEARFPVVFFVQSNQSAKAKRALRQMLGT